MRSRGIYTPISLKIVVATQENCFKLYDSCLTSLRKISFLSPHDDPCKLADDFGEFFCRKVDLIRNDIDAITVVPPVLNVPAPENKLEKFDVLSEEEVSDVIMGSSNTSCQLDPIRTWLLKLCRSELTPVITKMINLFLQQGQVPDSWKAALIRPLLKKLGLELVNKNFRPVSNLPMVSKSAEKEVVGQIDFPALL